ncbi:hypothetical protein RvY_13640 [Ramazzottius varieornatus]|uniref:Uncharacterized protein n=1 Tax=Ramazzottius varieornatus TaxID=947166 RepID=A0A1D1VW10_RAMVA|nr:hypothetical protein RvY_13640 [Ramazzottius varieornatus]
MHQFLPSQFLGNSLPTSLSCPARFQACDLPKSTCVDYFSVSWFSRSWPSSLSMPRLRYSAVADPGMVE